MSRSSEGVDGGSVYLRGDTYWIKFYIRGRCVRRSAKTKDRSKAETLLRQCMIETFPLRAKAPDARSKDIERFVAEHADISAGIILRSAVGAASELLVCVDLMNRGYEVFRALCPHASVDLLAMKDGAVYKVQVKTGKLTNRSRLLISLRHDIGRYDLLAVVVRDHGIFYRWAHDGHDASGLSIKDFSKSPERAQMMGTSQFECEPVNSLIT